MSAPHSSEGGFHDVDEGHQEGGAPELASAARAGNPESILQAVEARTVAAAQILGPPKPDPGVLEAKKEFFKHMDDHLLDYKHNHPVRIADCVAMLLKIFNNVLEHPEEQKFRQVKVGSNAFKSNVGSVKGGEKLMVLAGWRIQVREMEKYYVFEGTVGSQKMGVLSEATKTLQKALSTVNEKAERKRQEMQDTGAKERARKEQILRALEDDKEDRKLRTGIASMSAPEDTPAQALGGRSAEGQSSMHA